MSASDHTHKPRPGSGSPPYGSLRYVDIDGMRVVHAELVVRCALCGADFPIARLHLTESAWQAIARRA